MILKINICKSMEKRPIGVLDSGLGGKLVLNELKKQMPEENFVYLADIENFPYGNKTKEQIVSLTRINVKKLINQNVKLIVIACGTATSQAIETVRKEIDIPLIGIIEPTVEYIEKLNLKKIGVMATVGTIRSNAWEVNLKSRNANIKVINKACPNLATLAEQGKQNTKEAQEELEKELEMLKKENVEAIILGCTHYPVYKEMIKKQFDYNVLLIDTGEILAKYLKEKLRHKMS